MHRSWLIVGSCIVLGACGEDEPVIATWLDEIDEMTLSAGVEHRYDGIRVHATVVGAVGAIYLEGFSIRVGDHASMPGNASIDHGGTDVDFPRAPRIEMVVPPEHLVAGADLAITDGRTTLTLPLGDLLLPRTAAWLEPVDGVLRGGEALAIQWSPPGSADLVHYAAVNVGQVSAQLSLTADAAGVLRGTAPTLAPVGDTSTAFLWQAPVAEQPCLDGTCSVGGHGYLALPTAVVAPEAP
jgi:hypothetical protein